MFDELLEKIKALREARIDLEDKYPDYKDVPEDTHYEYFEIYDKVLEDTFYEYKNNLKNKDYRQKWELIPAGRLKKIWRDYAKLGFVRDEAGIEMIKDIAIQNIIKISVNTMLCGHTETNPERNLSDIFGEDLPNNYFGILDSFFDDERGNWRLSDYAEEPLVHNAIQLLVSKTAEDKLLIIDRILNIVHQRSDMASWFVQGGSKTLDDLAEN